MHFLVIPCMMKQNGSTRDTLWPNGLDTEMGIHGRARQTQRAKRTDQG